MLDIEITQRILHHCISLLQADDIDALRDMGFEERDLYALRTLQDPDRLRWASDGQLFEFILARRSYRKIIGELDSSLDDERMDVNLIAWNAPLPMMHALTGMGKEQYDRMRDDLATGESTLLDQTGMLMSDTTAMALWNRMAALVAESNLVNCRFFLELAELGDRFIPMPEVWTEFNRWLQDRCIEVRPAFHTVSGGYRTVSIRKSPKT